MTRAIPEPTGLQVFSRKPGVLWTDLDTHVALLDLTADRFFEANAVGAVIWKLLEEPRSISALVAHISAHFRVDRDRCDKDVQRFLEALRGAGLLEQ